MIVATGTLCEVGRALGKCAVAGAAATVSLVAMKSLLVWGTAVMLVGEQWPLNLLWYYGTYALVGAGVRLWPSRGDVLAAPVAVLAGVVLAGYIGRHVDYSHTGTMYWLVRMPLARGLDNAFLGVGVVLAALMARRTAVQAASRK